MTRDGVEQMIKDKMVKFNEEMKLKDVEKKALNLKIKSSRNSRDTNAFGYWDSPAEDTTTKTPDLKNEIDMLKLEIVKELRDAKNTTVTSNKQTESSMDRMSESLGLVL